MCELNIDFKKEKFFPKKFSPNLPQKWIFAEQKTPFKQLFHVKIYDDHPQKIGGTF
jgi:hypothetical protein